MFEIQGDGSVKRFRADNQEKNLFNTASFGVTIYKHKTCGGGTTNGSITWTSERPSDNVRLRISMVLILLACLCEDLM